MLVSAARSDAKVTPSSSTSSARTFMGSGSCQQRAPLRAG
jgi:hypothetical protein